MFDENPHEVREVDCERWIWIWYVLWSRSVVVDKSYLDASARCYSGEESRVTCSMGDATCGQEVS